MLERDFRWLSDEVQVTDSRIEQESMLVNDPGLTKSSNRDVYKPRVCRSDACVLASQMFIPEATNDGDDEELVK